MAEKAPIFISYKSEEREFALLIRDKLREWGYEAWLDVDRLQPGSLWANEIDRALKTCQACLGIMTPRAIASRFVTNEWDMVIMQNKPFIPLLFERTEPHYKYVDLQFIDCTAAERETGLNKLRTRLDAGLAKPAPGADDSAPYEEYLNQLYDRINTYLAAKLVPNLRDEAERPDPVALPVEHKQDAVDVLFEKREEIDPLFAIGGIAGEPQQVFNDFVSAFDHYERRVLLLGEPGAGKTITLLQFARDAVVKRRQDRTAPLPVLGIIPTWDANQYTSVNDWLARSFGAPAGLANLLTEGKTLLLLDGLDELGQSRLSDPTDPDSPRFDPRVEFMRQIPQNNGVVVSCRTRDYAEIGEKIKLKGAVVLTPPTAQQIGLFLQDQPALRTLLDGDEQFKIWLQTPLLLSLFAFTYAQLGDSEKADFANVQTKGELRKKIIGSFIRQRYDHERRKPGRHMPELSRLYEATSFVAVWGENGTGSKKREYGVGFNSTFTLPLVTSPRLLSLVEQDLPGFIQQLEALNVVSRIDHETYRFNHMLLCYHFALPVVSTLCHVSFFRGEFGDTLALMIRDMDDPEAIPDLRHLIEHGDNITSFTAQRVLDELNR